MSTSCRILPALGLLAILILVATCGATQSASLTPGDAAQGGDLWLRSACVGCHGPEAEGSRLGPALADTPLTIREVVNITRRGGPGMPSYSASEISDEDLQDIYAWFQAPVSIPTPEPTQATPTGGPGQPNVSVEQGQALWADLGCGACHGPDAGGASAPALAGTSRALADFQDIVRQGRPGMPAYTEALIGDQGLEAVYAWLQSQSQGQAPGQTPALEETMWLQMGCGGCHGANAEGASAPALAGKQVSYDEFERVVRDGAEGMPAYSAERIGDSDLRRMYDALTALP